MYCGALYTYKRWSAEKSCGREPVSLTGIAGVENIRGKFMRQNLLTSVILTGGCLLLLSGSPVLAQMPAQPGQPGMPGQNPAMTRQTPNVPAETTPQMSNKVDDKRFVRDADMSGMTEIALGKLAADKGATDAVKKFGQKMVDDHTKADEELKKLAEAKSVSLPDSLDSKHQSRVDKLSKLSGAAFDKAYIKDAKKDHEQDVRDYQAEAHNGSDADVKSYASKTLPDLQQHLAMVKGLSKGKTETADADRSKQ
jgi:putative membrane protein